MLIAASRDGLASAAHDLSEGGLIQAVIESALAGETGCRIVLPEESDPFIWLFSESAGRALVALPRTEESRFRAMCEARGLPPPASASPMRSRISSRSKGFSL